MEGFDMAYGAGEGSGFCATGPFEAERGAMGPRERWGIVESGSYGEGRGGNELMAAAVMVS